MSDAAIDFRELLETPLDKFPDRPNLPGNKYFYGKLIGMAATHSRNKGTPGYHFSVRLTDPGKDVSADEIKKIADAGFNLADYEVGSDFWITPGSMVFLRRFVESLGFPIAGVGLKECLSLDDTYSPTPATIEKIRGLDVLVRTPPADEQGRVFLNNVDSIAGVKKG